MGIPGNKSKRTKQILKTTSRKHSENNKDLEGKGTLSEKTDLEESTPRHILAKFLDSIEKKIYIVNHQGKKPSNLYGNTVFKFQENELCI